MDQHTCRICGNSSGNSAYAVRETMYGLDESFTYFQCSACQCLQIAEVPLDMARYYPKQYYSYSLPGNSMARKARLLRDRYVLLGTGIIGRYINGKVPNPALAALKKLPVSQQDRILDVGCGAGAELYSLRECGFKNVMGIDPFIEQDIEYGNGLRIEKKTLRAAAGEWDIIMFHHSLEHVPDQAETFASIRRLLASNGTCMIRVPIASSFAWEHYRANWIQIDAPRHLYLHSLKSMELLAHRNRLKIVAVAYDSTAYQFWASEQAAKGIALRSDKSYKINAYRYDLKRSIFSKNDMKRFEEQAKTLNETNKGDQAVFYLK
jgi:SAM-dependent methyltransferase